MIGKRNRNTRRFRTAAGMLAIGGTLVLSGCGGGGGSSSNTRTGVFVDAPVSGVQYQTESGSGVTDANGQFEYRVGETVTFTLGSLELGSAQAASEVTVFDLANVEQPPRTQEELSDQLWENGFVQGSPLQRALNTGILLQTLDQDGNPANGIVIEPAVAALVTPADIDLDATYTEFANGGNLLDGTGLPGLLRSAADASLLSPRSVVKPANALQHLLAQQNLAIDVEVSTTYTSDDNADGNADYAQITTYADTGKVLQYESDTDGDGIYENINAYTYDAEINLTGSTLDRDGDGVFEETRVREYDAFGALTSDIRRNASGTITNSTTLQWDAEGRLVRREIIAGSSHTIEFWIPDNNGMRSTYEVDRNGDGNIDERSILTYGNQTRGDRWLQSDKDLDLDGTPDARTTRTFSELGQLVSVERDDNLDGTPEYVRRRIRDAAGRELSYEEDRDGGGVDFIREYTRNSDGLVTEQRVDRQGDRDFETVIRYSYDASGNLLESNTFLNGNSQPSSSVNYTYNTANLRTSIAYDTNADGNADSITRYTYTTSGQLQRSERDSDADGNADEISVYGGFRNVGLAYVL